MLITEISLHKLAKYLPCLRTALRVDLALLAAAVVVLSAFGSAGAFTAEQADKGREIFRLQCARCHAPAGQGITDIYRGMTAPPLIGPTAFPLDPRPYQKMRHF